MTDRLPETARELLSRAAETLRGSASTATPGPWDAFDSMSHTVVGRGVERTGRGSYRCIQDVAEIGDDRTGWVHDDEVLVEPVCDAEYIALMHPPVALALAALLEQHSAWLAQADDDTPADGADLGDIGHVVEVARTVLRIGGAR